MRIVEIIILFLVFFYAGYGIITRHTSLLTVPAPTKVVRLTIPDLQCDRYNSRLKTIEEYLQRRGMKY